NITTAETTDSGGVSRTMVAWNKSTKVMRVEYNSLQGTASASSAGVYLYRLYYDETNDDGQILSTEGGSSDSSLKSIRYVLAGKPSTGDAFSISMIQDQDTTTNHLNNGALTEACVSSSNGNLITDGSRCAETSSRTAGAAINQSSIVTLLGNYYSDRTNTAWGTADANTTISWSTKTEMLSVASEP
ncbi:MAG: hypothetical protein L6Q37_05710, partial [Bdellovibrionaceae bacterium]|nr:hypothetical protein [Pseudobdellovibrionaceae bacterium]